MRRADLLEHSATLRPRRRARMRFAHARGECVRERRARSAACLPHRADAHAFDPHAIACRLVTRRVPFASASTVTSFLRERREHSVRRLRPRTCILEILDTISGRLVTQVTRIPLNRLLVIHSNATELPSRQAKSYYPPSGARQRGLKGSGLCPVLLSSSKP